MSKEKTKINANPVGANCIRPCYNDIAKNKRGITIVSLVITIILMLILVGVTITTALNGSLFEQAKRAVNNTEIEQEKEIISQAFIQIKELDVENLKKELSNYNVEVFEDVGKIIVKFIDTNRYYEIDVNRKIEYLDISEAKTITVICKDSAENIIGQKEYVILTERYSIILPQIEGYEALTEKLEGKTKEDLNLTTTYYKIFDDDTELVFTGLNSSGDITTIESEIESYMVGDGSGNAGNGLKEKNIQGILKIPDTYNDKPVTQIGQYAFSSISNIKKSVTGNNVKQIGSKAFERAKIEQLITGENLEKIGTSAFRYCYNLKSVTINTEAMLKFGGEAFRYCYDFSEIIINSENKTYKVEDNILYTIDGEKLVLCLPGRSGEFIVPDKVKTINQNSFNSTNLTKVVINTVDTIQTQAFERATLEEIVIGESVIDIGSYTFRYCDDLKTIIIDSPTIVSKLTSQTACGNLINNATTIYIKEDIKSSVTTYITDNYSEQTTDKEGYIKYVKNS